LFVILIKSTDMIMMNAFYISFEIPVCGILVPLVAKVHTVKDMKIYCASSITVACGNSCISISCNVKIKKIGEGNKINWIDCENDRPSFITNALGDAIQNCMQAMWN
jgi:hypothetical protein